MPQLWNQFKRTGHKSIEEKPSIVHQTPATQSAPLVKHRKTFLFLGIIEYFVGVTTVGVAIESLSRDIRDGRYPSVYFDYILTLAVQGISCGLLMIFAGIVGMSATKKPTACMRSANRILRTLTAIFTTVAVVTSVVVAISSYGHIEQHILHLLLPSLLLVEIILSVAHCAFSCARTESKKIGGISDSRFANKSDDYKASMQAAYCDVDVVIRPKTEQVKMYTETSQIDTESVLVAAVSSTLPSNDDPPSYTALSM